MGISSCRQWVSLIVATGGGVILRDENVNLMRSSGSVVYLETSLEYLWKRIQAKRGRPLLKGKNPREKLEQIFLAREPLYQKACDFQVNTDGQTAEQVAQKIFERIKK